jgi:hypothetical protein
LVVLFYFEMLEPIVLLIPEKSGVKSDDSLYGVFFKPDRLLLFFLGLIFYLSTGSSSVMVATSLMSPFT